MIPDPLGGPGKGLSGGHPGDIRRDPSVGGTIAGR